MKAKIVILILSVVFLASCSNMRYGHMPKAKKQKHAVAKTTEKKKEHLAETEGIAAKPAEVASTPIAAEIPLAPQKTVIGTIPAPAKETATPAVAPQTVEKANNVKEQLSPRQVKKLEKLKKQTETKEIAKGSWLWYVVVGLVLVILAYVVYMAIPLLGWLLYLAGCLAILYGLLMLLGII